MPEDKKKAYIKWINYSIWFGIFLFLLITYKRCNKWHERLTSNDGKLTIAHIYNSQTIDGTIYFNYIYKVGEKYYTESTTGNGYVESLEQEPIQCFLVAYDQKDPTIHTVIWSYKSPMTFPLGKTMDSIPNVNELIRKHTIGNNGLSPRSKVNNTKAIKEYLKLKKSTHWLNH